MDVLAYGEQGDPVIGGLLVLAMAFIVLVLLAADKVRKPNATCSRCRGTGRRRSTVRTDAWGDCRACGGQGHRKRLL